jgi:hypothetical protein
MKLSCCLVTELVTFRLPMSDPFQLPSINVRSNKRGTLEGVESSEQECILFEDFITVCRGKNTRHIQCSYDDETKRFEWNTADGPSEAMQKWMKSCIKMATNFFELVTIIRGRFSLGPLCWC